MSQLRERRRRSRADDRAYKWLYDRYCTKWHPAIAAIEAHEALRLGWVTRKQCRPA